MRDLLAAMRYPEGARRGRHNLGKVRLALTFKGSMLGLLHPDNSCDLTCGSKAFNEDMLDVYANDPAVSQLYRDGWMRIGELMHLSCRLEPQLNTAEGVLTSSPNFDGSIRLDRIRRIPLPRDFRFYTHDERNALVHKRINTHDRSWLGQLPRGVSIIAERLICTRNDREVERENPVPIPIIDVKELT